MEKSWRCRGGVWLLCSLFMLSLLICSTNADEEYDKKYYPTGNVNLTPFAQYLSIYQCMLNVSDNCQPKYYSNEIGYNLTEGGWPNVTDPDTDAFCNGGCALHTRAVLECIFLVKQDYKFADKHTVQELNHTVIQGCIDGAFPENDVIPLPSSAMRASGRAGFGIIFSVVSAVLMAYSHV